MVPDSRTVLEFLNGPTIDTKYHSGTVPEFQIHFRFRNHRCLKMLEITLGNDFFSVLPMAAVELVLKLMLSGLQPMVVCPLTKTTTPILRPTPFSTVTLPALWKSGILDTRSPVHLTTTVAPRTRWSNWLRPMEPFLQLSMPPTLALETMPPGCMTDVQRKFYKRLPFSVLKLWFQIAKWSWNSRIWNLYQIQF